MPTVDVSLPQGPGYDPTAEEAAAAAGAPAAAAAPRGPGYAVGTGDTIFRPWGVADPALMTPAAVVPAHVVPAGSKSHNAKQVRKLSILSNAVAPSLKGVSYTLDLRIGAVGWLQNVRVEHLVAMQYIAEDQRFRRARARAAAAARAGAEPAAVRAAGKVVPEDDDGDVTIEAAENGFATCEWRAGLRRAGPRRAGCGGRARGRPRGLADGADPPHPPPPPPAAPRAAPPDVYDRFTCLCPVPIAAYAYPRLYHETGMCGLARVCRTPGCEHSPPPPPAAQ